MRNWITKARECIPNACLPGVYSHVWRWAVSPTGRNVSCAAGRRRCDSPGQEAWSSHPRATGEWVGHRGSSPPHPPHRIHRSCSERPSRCLGVATISNIYLLWNEAAFTPATSEKFWGVIGLTWVLAVWVNAGGGIIVFSILIPILDRVGRTWSGWKEKS